MRVASDLKRCFDGMLITASLFYINGGGVTCGPGDTGRSAGENTAMIRVRQEWFSLLLRFLLVLFPSVSLFFFILSLFFFVFVVRLLFLYFGDDFAVMITNVIDVIALVGITVSLLLPLSLSISHYRYQYHYQVFITIAITTITAIANITTQHYHRLRHHPQPSSYPSP